MDDIKTVVKELRRAADAGERIARALEKQNKVMNTSLNMNEGTAEPDEET